MDENESVTEITTDENTTEITEISENYSCTEGTGAEHEDTEATSNGSVDQISHNNNDHLVENNDAEETVEISVEFVVEGTDLTHKMNFDIDTPSVYLYEKIEKNFGIRRHDMNLMLFDPQGTAVEETTTLKECLNHLQQDAQSQNVNGILTLQVKLHLATEEALEQFRIGVGAARPQQTQEERDIAGDLGVESAPTEQKAKNLIEVEMFYGDGIPSKHITVSITRAPKKKPFLGGFRDVKTQLEYHHASTQTDPKPKDPIPEEKRITKFHRETQTKEIKTRSQQTFREQGTQMSKKGVLIDEANDIIIIPRPYFTAAQLEQLRLEKTITIQAYVRGWFARRRAARMKAQLLESREAARAAEERARAEAAARKKREIERRMHPRTPSDFNILYSELEAWRLQETDAIKQSNMDPAEQHAALQELLRKETKLLQTIDRLKISANAENKQKRISGKLEKMASAKKWANTDGGTTYVETPFTIRARELTELYHGLNTPMLSVDERLDVLLHVKWTVKEFDCQLTRDIVELIDREADLLNRGRKDKSLEGLRKRISNLFLQFIETPEFNPESIHYTRVPIELLRRPQVQVQKK